MMDINKIQEYLPHRYPFLLVDRVLEIKPGEKIIAIKNVTMNEWFFQGHFPGRPVMPGVLIVEAMAQAGGILVLEQIKEAKGKVIYFMTIDAVKFRKPVVPGDTLRFEIIPIKLKGNIAKLHGDAYVGDEKVAEADMMAMLSEK
ncbi:MAG: 3-hydroxyacyl-ACP dehydratase FabZ [Candidatus Goldbacteria bacterium]|nr:3-hydroxyacyl-ACP dehydratase FabZ [Candidatus Goldiibacteriota bacterium]